MKTSSSVLGLMAAGLLVGVSADAQAPKQGDPKAIQGAEKAIQAEQKADSSAVKPCQEEIRKKVRADHKDVRLTFESVETSAISDRVTGVKGKLRMGKGDDAATLDYTCRVDKDGMVKRAEYGKEKN